MNSEYTYKTKTGTEYTNKFGVNMTFLNDFYNKSFKDFLYQYRHIPVYFRTVIGKWEYEDGYVELRGRDDNGYLQVPSTKRWISYNGKRSINKVKQQERDTCLNVDGRYILKIRHKTITKEQFVYSIVKLMDVYYDLSDGLVNQDYIIDKCVDLWNVYFMVNNKVEGDKNKKFLIDNEYWSDRNITNGWVIYGKVRKTINDKDLQSVYDFNLTLEENLTMMKDFGVSLSKNTVLRWLRENGYSYKTDKGVNKEERNRMIIQLYNEDRSRSLRELVSLMKEKGFKVNKDTIKKVIMKEK